MLEHFNVLSADLPYGSLCKNYTQFYTSLMLENNLLYALTDLQIIRILVANQLTSDKGLSNVKSFPPPTHFHSTLYLLVSVFLNTIS